MTSAGPAVLLPAAHARWAVAAIAGAALLSFGYCYGYAWVMGGEASLLTSLGWMLADWSVWLPLAPLLATAGAHAACLPGGAGVSRALWLAAVAIAVALATRALIDAFGGQFSLLPLLYKRLPVFVAIAAAAGALGYACTRARVTRTVSVPLPVPVSDELCLPVQSARGEHVLPVSAIASLEACGNYIEVRAGAATYLMRTTMKALEERLSGTSMVRCHRSFFVNLGKVVRMEYRPTGNHVLVMAGGGLVPVSKSCRETVRGALARLGGAVPA